MEFHFEGRVSRIADCPNCQNYRDPDWAEAVFKLTSGIVENESDRGEYVRERTDEFLQHVARAYARATCICGFWKQFTAELSKASQHLRVIEDDTVPFVLANAGRIWSEHEQFAPVLDYLSKYVPGRVVVEMWVDRLKGGGDESSP